MKRYILVAIVLFAAMLTIYFIVTNSEKETQDESSRTTEERDVLGLTAVSGSADATDGGSDAGATDSPSDSGSAGDAGSATDSTVQSGEDEAAAAMAENSSADETELEAKARSFSENIVQGLTSRVLDEANDKLKSQTTIKDLNLSFESVTSSLGEYIGVERVSSSTENGYRAVTATLRYEGNDGATIRYIFDDADKLAGIWFDNTSLAASVEKGSRYEEKKLRLGRTPFVLDGILTLPIGAVAGSDSSDSDGSGSDSSGSGGTGSNSRNKKPPVVLLISDRDDADMDGTVGEANNKPLRDVAHGLALRGIASIRYNRRLNQYPDTADSNAGIREFLIKDAWMAIDAAYHDSSVDTDAVFVLAWGRSAEYLEPILDRRIQRVAGAILIGAKPAKHSEMSYADEDIKVEADAKYFMTKHDTFPLMLLQGERDYETPVSQFERWQTLFTGRSHTAYHQYKLLGHYLWTGSATPSATDYDSPNTVSNQAIGDIANWCAEVAIRD